MRSFTLRVSDEILAVASREHCRRCPVARAIRALGGLYPTVTAETISFNFGKTRYTFPTPAKVAHKLIEFDAGKTMAPFTVYLDGNRASTRPVKTPIPARGQLDVTKLIKGSKALTKKKRESPRARWTSKRIKGMKELIG